MSWVGDDQKYESSAEKESQVPTIGVFLQAFYHNTSQGWQLQANDICIRIATATGDRMWHINIKFATSFVDPIDLYICELCIRFREEKPGIGE